MQHRSEVFLSVRWRKAWRTAGSLAVVIGLSACGGSDSGTAVPDSGGGTESAHWQSTVVGSQAGGWSWLIVDPAAPASGRVSQALSTTTPASPQMLSQRSVDGAARTVTELGNTFAFVADDGKVWRADLRGGHSHQPVTVSSLADACSVDQVLPLNAAGDEAWLVVSVHAGQQYCSERMLVRSSWDGSQSAIALGSTRVLTVLNDDSGQAQALLAAVPAPLGSGEWLRAYDTNFQPMSPLTPPADGVSVAYPTAFVAVDGDQGGSGYVSVNAELRRLHWAAGSVTLDATSLYQFLNTPASPAALPHAGGLYLADGPRLLDVHAAGGSTLLALLQDGEVVREFARTSTHLVFSSDVSYLAHYVQSVPLGGGAVTVLMADYMARSVALVGVAGDWVVTMDAGGSLGTVTYTRSLADGSQKTEINSLLDQAQGPVVGDMGAGQSFSATAPLGGPAPLHSVLVCTATVQGNDIPCTGPLNEVEVASLSITTLGSFGNAGAYAFGRAVLGLPGLVLLRNASTSIQDAEVFQSGVAGSLQKLSNYLP